MDTAGPENPEPWNPETGSFTHDNAVGEIVATSKSLLRDVRSIDRLQGAWGMLDGPMDCFTFVRVILMILHFYHSRRLFALTGCHRRSPRTRVCRLQPSLDFPGDSPSNINPGGRFRFRRISGPARGGRIQRRSTNGVRLLPGLLDSALRHVAWLKDLGFLCVVRKSDAHGWEDGTEGIRRGILQCSRSGVYRPHRKVDSTTVSTQTRPSKSRKTGCPFEISYSYNTSTALYLLTSTTNPNHVDNLTHNHPPDEAACFWQYRRLPDDMLQFATDLVSKMSPGSILGCLQAKFGRMCLATYHDIRNLQQRLWRLERRGMRATEAMLSVLRSVNMSSRHWLHPETAELLGVIITDPLAITLAQTYGQVLQMDCTYKTNIQHADVPRHLAYVDESNLYRGGVFPEAGNHGRLYARSRRAGQLHSGSSNKGGSDGLGGRIVESVEGYLSSLETH